MEGTDGSVGLKVMPIDNVTLSDGCDPGERAPTRRHVLLSRVDFGGAERRVTG
jgi:hypothetical protein